MPVAYIPRACSLTAGRRALGCQANYICRRLNDLQVIACKSFAECRIMGLQAETECTAMDNTNGINDVDEQTGSKAMGTAIEGGKGKGEARSDVGFTVYAGANGALQYRHECGAMVSMGTKCPRCTGNGARPR